MMMILILIYILITLIFNYVNSNDIFNTTISIPIDIYLHFYNFNDLISINENNFKN